jgi:hypothetical protein
VWTESFAAALSTARQFRSLPRPDLDVVASALKTGWSELHRCIRQLAAALGLHLSSTAVTSEETEQTYLALLNNLAGDLAAVREESPPSN